MICTVGRLSLAANVFAALLVVTILNAYLIHTRFQGESERDSVLHYAKHIHVNKQSTLHSSSSTSSSSLPSPDPKLISSNNPHKNLNNQNTGGEQTNNNNNNDKNKKVQDGHENTLHTLSKRDKEELRKEWREKPTRTDKGSKYARDTCLPRPTDDKDLLDLPLTVVTASSEGYTGHVHNLIGSVHTHQPDAEIVVYNMGFSEDSVRDFENYCRVTVRKFDFGQLPSHTTNLKNFAWKALVVKQALLDYGKILYLDGGIEVRRPLDFITGRIEREGYFCIGMGDSLTRGGREGMFNFYNTSSLQYLGMPMAAGGVQGATFWGGAYEGIVVPAAECSMSASCILPDRNGDEVRSFGKDQPLFSGNVYRGGCAQCAMSSHFTAYSAQASQAGDPFVAGKQQLFVRRGSGPFNGRGKRKSTCPDWKPYNFQKWQSLRGQVNSTFLGNGGCPHTRFQEDREIDKSYVLGDVHRTVENVVGKVRKEEMVIVSGGGSAEFAKLLDLVESVNKWEPNRKIVIFDLGLEASQASDISKKMNVEVEKFDFASHPAHVKETKNMAWKVIAWAQVSQTHGSFLFLSHSHVLYQHLDSLIYQLMRDGIFSVTVGANLMELISENSAVKFFGSWPAASKDRRADGGEKLMKEFDYKPTCTASVTGFWKDSKASKLVLPPLYDCAIDATCWSSTVSSVKNQKDADSLQLSLMIYDKICYTCNRDYDFYAYAGKRESLLRFSHPNMLELSLIDEIQVVYDTIS